jgi:hypothetical protein
MQPAYDTFNEQIGVRLSYVISDMDKRKPGSLGLISYSAYEKRAKRSEGFRLRAAHGKGNDVLLNWVNLPHDWQMQLIENFGDPTKEARPNVVQRFYARDPKAADVYSNYITKDGKNLKAKLIKEYIANASICEAVIKAESYAKAKRKSLGGSTLPVWDILMQDVEALRATTGHTLPIPSMRRIIRDYKLDKYESLISGRLCNDNRRKVTAQVESMLLSLYAMPNKPFATSVSELYQSFLDGKIDVVDRQTGEFFNRSDFFRNGEPIEISEQTVWNYINNPLNRAIVDKSRMDALDYNNTHRPHARRHAPKYSFSKVSMDDRDLPRKIIGGGRVKAYYSYDVTSGAVVGYAYSRNKDEELFLECLRDMFRLMDKQGWGVPMEVEVENHLVNKFFDDLGVMFPIVRICAPGNSQEKRAEHFNKAKKYGVEKATQTGIGRWWARSEAFRTKSNKVSNEYVEKSYEYDMLVADDVKAIADYNNQLHPKQKRYPGMTRWQVLCYNINPNVTQVNRAVWMKAIGNYTDSSIKRSKFVTVQYNQYELPNPAVISRLKPNNYKVDAYWLPNEFGEIKEVYLYQAGEFLCRAALSETFNEATAEWEDTDKEIYTQQSAYTAKFDSMVKKGRAEKLVKPEIISAKAMKAIEMAETAIATPPPVTTPEQDLDKRLADAMLKWGGTHVTENIIK